MPEFKRVKLITSKINLDIKHRKGLKKLEKRYLKLQILT